MCTPGKTTSPRRPRWKLKVMTLRCNVQSELIEGAASWEVPPRFKKIIMVEVTFSEGKLVLMSPKGEMIPNVIFIVMVQGHIADEPLSLVCNFRVRSGAVEAVGNKKLRMRDSAEEFSVKKITKQELDDTTILWVMAEAKLI